MKIKAQISDKPQKPQLNILAVSGRSEQLCPKCKVPMKALYDKMACFKCMTHTP